MSFSYLKQLPTPEEIKQTYPLNNTCKKIKCERDEEISRVLRGESDKFLVIIGPCSADKEEPVMDYIHRLARVNEQTKDKLILIPRIYTNKPRTTGEGYKGIATQPDPEAKPDMIAGLIAVRICVPLKKPVCPLQMKCFTRKTGTTSTICSPTWLSVLVP